jgi:hypothetical protein
VLLDRDGRQSFNAFVIASRRVVLCRREVIVCCRDTCYWLLPRQDVPPEIAKDGIVFDWEASLREQMKQPGETRWMRWRGGDGRRWGRVGRK